MKLCQLACFPITFTIALNILTIAARPTGTSLQLEDRAIPSAASENGGKMIHPDDTTHPAVYPREFQLLMYRSPRMEKTNNEYQPSPPSPPNSPQLHAQARVDQEDSRNLALVSQIVRHMLLRTNFYRLVHTLATANHQDEVLSYAQTLHIAYTSLGQSVQRINHNMPRGAGQEIRNEPSAENSRSRDLWGAYVPRTNLGAHAKELLCYMPPTDSESNTQRVGENLKTAAELIREVDASSFPGITRVYRGNNSPTGELISDINRGVFKILHCLAVLCNKLHEGYMIGLKMGDGEQEIRNPQQISAIEHHCLPQATNH